MKTTPVEWLGLQLNMLFTGITEEQWDKAEKLFQQAKEMEKQQIIDAVEWNYKSNMGEVYYNATYKNNKL